MEPGEDDHLLQPDDEGLQQLPQPQWEQSPAVPGVYNDHNPPHSKSLEALELILQKMLRSLCALADNFDRVVTSFEARHREENVWSLKSVGSDIRERGLKFLTPSDRSLLVLCSSVVLFSFVLFFGFKVTPEQLVKSPEGGEEFVAEPALRIQLPDGRNVSYREQGVGASQARHSVLVVHGFLSSRLAGIPGMNSSLLEEFGVRLVAYDLPGIGESDVHPERSYNTSALDIVSIADALGLGEQFWLLAFSEGGPHAWAAIKYIPHRLAGVAMFSPAGNPYGGNLSSQEAAGIWSSWSFRRKLLHVNAKRFPSLLRGFLRRTLLNKIEQLRRSLSVALQQKDLEIFQHAEFIRLWEQDLRESMKQQRLVPLAQELLQLVNNWGFDLGDLQLQKPPVKGFMNKLRGFLSQEQVKLIGFQKPIHIWQGTEDVIVPPAFNEFAKRILPQVNLHLLEGEGHFSWFYLCQECHRIILETLFGAPQGPLLQEEPELSATD